ATETVWITDEELDARPELVKTMSVQPPRGAGRVRLLKIPGIDLQPCGGTHVANIGEIGAIRVVRIRNEGKKNKRVEIALGGLTRRVSADPRSTQLPTSTAVDNSHPPANDAARCRESCQCLQLVAANAETARTGLCSTADESPARSAAPVCTSAASRGARRLPQAASSSSRVRYPI